MNNSKIINRINILKIEIIMGNYYDGWTLRGLKNELENLIKTINNDNGSIL